MTTADYLTYEQEVMERVLRMHEELIHPPDRPDREGSDSPDGRSEDRGETDRDRGPVKE